MQKKKNIKLLLTSVIFLVMIGLLASSIYFYRQYQILKENPDLISQKEVASVVEKISKYMELPSDEEPSLATITDVEQLQDHDFFKNAQNGDRILIYANAQKAILYRPKTGKVIEFAPLITQSDSEENEVIDASSGTNKTESVSVTIYNGTEVVGLTTEIEKELAAIDNLSVVEKTNATHKDYEETLVIDFSGSNTALANQIANQLSGKTTTLPDGENKPDSDILIIAAE